MNSRDAVTALEKQAATLRDLGATSLYLFGSTIRDAAGEQSDLDLFMDYAKDSRFSLIELVAIKNLLERPLGLPVDIATRDSLDPLLRGRIEASAHRIF